MSPLLRRPAMIGAIALALLIGGMIALAALKAAWATIKLFLFLAVIAALAFVLWRGWRRWKRWQDRRKANRAGDGSGAAQQATLSRVSGDRR